MIKTLPISKAVDEAICEICKIESSANVRQSYSKIANYLIALGVDRYNQLFKQKVKSVNFDFGKYDRKNIHRATSVQSSTILDSPAPLNNNANGAENYTK